MLEGDASQKRKYEDRGLSLTYNAAIPPARPETGFSTPIASSESPAAAAIAATTAATPSYNSVPSPLDGIQLAKQQAKEIAAWLLSDTEAKCPRVENGGPGDAPAADKGFGFSAAELSHLHKPVGRSSGEEKGSNGGVEKPLDRQWGEAAVANSFGGEMPSGRGGGGNQRLGEKKW